MDKGDNFVMTADRVEENILYGPYLGRIRNKAKKTPNRRKNSPISVTSLSVLATFKHNTTTLKLNRYLNLYILFIYKNDSHLF